MLCERSNLRSDFVLYSFEILDLVRPVYTLKEPHPNCILGDRYNVNSSLHSLVDQYIPLKLQSLAFNLRTLVEHAFILPNTQSNLRFMTVDIPSVELPPDTPDLSSHVAIG